LRDGALDQLDRGARVIDLDHRLAGQERTSDYFARLSRDVNHGAKA